MLTEISLINALLFPEESICLLIIISSSQSIDNSERIFLTAVFFEILNSAEIVHEEVPVLIMLVLALAPNNKSIESIIMDFPAPVSPVITVSPFLKSIVIFSIRA